VVSIAIAKVEFLSVQTFGNIDLPVRCTGTASGAWQTGATLAEQIEDEVARLYQRIRVSEKTPPSLLRRRSPPGDSQNQAKTCATNSP